MKVATVLFILSLLFHAWIGIWTIFTDYVKPYVLRAVLNVLVLLMLAACFFWGIIDFMECLINESRNTYI